MNLERNAPPKPATGSGRLERYKRRITRRSELVKLERKAKLAAIQEDRARRFRIYLRDGRRDRVTGEPLLFETDNLLKLAHCHHIIHRSNGGSDDDSNLCMLGPQTHQKHHDGLLDITGNANVTLKIKEYKYEGGTRRLLREWESTV